MSSVRNHASFRIVQLFVLESGRYTRRTVEATRTTMAEEAGKSSSSSATEITTAPCRCSFLLDLVQ